MAAFLSMTCYSDEGAASAMILRRLQTIYPFVKEGNMKDVYIPQDSFLGFPESFRHHPLANPDLYPDDKMELPWIHDINAFLHSSFVTEDKELSRKVEAIMAFTLRPEYRKLHPGYG